MELLTMRILGQISTHTSRVGCDMFFVLSLPVFSSISTHTSRVGCDNNTGVNLYFFEISTHTSRVGCDFVILINPVIKDNFYSHIPCGMWQLCQHRQRLPQNFYSHIPCGMWRRFRCGRDQLNFISTHTSRVGCDDVNTFSPVEIVEAFLLTHPVWDVTAIYSILQP